MTLRKRPSKILWKEEKMLLTAVFSTLPEVNFNFLVAFILLSANALGFRMSEILPFGKKKKMLVINISFFHVFLTVSWVNFIILTPFTCNSLLDRSNYFLWQRTLNKNGMLKNKTELPPLHNFFYLTVCAGP